MIDSGVHFAAAADVAVVEYLTREGVEAGAKSPAQPSWLENCGQDS